MSDLRTPFDSAVEARMLADVPDDGTRACLAAHDLFVDPTHLNDDGTFLAAVEWCGRAFTVYGSAMNHRGTFASWQAAKACLSSTARIGSAA